jgi:hypothetical protein
MDGNGQLNPIVGSRPLMLFVAREDYEIGFKRIT